MITMKESVLSLKQQHNIGFPTFQLAASTKNILWLTRCFWCWRIW